MESESLEVMESDDGHGNSNIRESEAQNNLDPKEEYFTSYENIDVHRLMLGDKVRTSAYKNAIKCAEDLFKDKIVMDVGAGTGILSIFSAQAGAKKVIAVEASNLALLLPQIFEKNGFKDVIEVKHSKVEEIELDEKVDIIVSEWMGFYLLHESMLNSVIFARDNFLKPDSGLIFPNSAKIYAAPCNLASLWNEKVGYWAEKQYDVDLSPFLPIAQHQLKLETYQVPPEGLLSEPQLLWSLDLNNIGKSDLVRFHDRRFFSVDEDEVMHGVCIWFTCSFPMSPLSKIDEDELELSTAPWSSETHWKQSVILLPGVPPEELESGDIIGWDIVIEKECENSRSYKIQLEMLNSDVEHPIPCQCGSVKCLLISHFNEQAS